MAKTVQLFQTRKGIIPCNCMCSEFSEMLCSGNPGDGIVCMKKELAEALEATDNTKYLGIEELRARIGDAISKYENNGGDAA